MKVKIKRSGVFFIGITIFLGAAAVNTGNNLLYMVVSALLSFMFFSGTFSMLNLKGLSLRLIPPPEVFVGRSNRFRVLLKKEGYLPSFLIRVSRGNEMCVFPMVWKREEVSNIYLSFLRRGFYESLTLEVSSSFPFGLFVRSFRKEVKLNLTVFPKPVPTDLGVVLSSQENRGEAKAKTLYEGYEDIKNIKEYAGEPMKLIHWKLSAKRSSLMVKEMVAEEMSPVVLSLDSVPGRDIEEKLGRLTYLIIELEKRGVPVGLKIEDKEIPPSLGESHKRVLLKELALFS